MKTLKFWYYGTLFLVFNCLFRLALNWASDYDTVIELADTSNHYFLKMEEHSIV